MTKKKSNTKTKTFKNIDEYKKHLNKLREDGQAGINNYQSFVLNSLGIFPKTQEELLAFIENVLKIHGVIK